jgi:VWFA-related protein
LRTTLLAIVFAAILTLALAALASAADPVNIQIMAVEEQPGQMTLTVSAVDEKGKPFPGLGPSSFNAWVNDQPLIVRTLETDTTRLPASVLLLVDVSGSMAGEPMNQSRAAIQQFIDSLDAQDQVAVMSFANNVQMLQDFTADRAALANAVTRLVPIGETALYDGVIQAAEHMASAPAGRKLIVLLSDGSATIGVNKRSASIQATQAAGVGVVAFGLGTGIDRKYLADLATASGGRVLEATTPAAIKQAYADLASAIRSQYTIHLDVPRSIDRTSPGQLKVHVIYRADNAFAERELGPLEGALPPPFSITLKGLAPGDQPSGVISLLPAVQQGIEVAKLDYYLDDNVIHTADAGAPGFDLDASALGPGSHVLKIVATDASGREGEVQVPFIVPEVVASSGGTSIPVIPLALLAFLAIVAYLVHRFLWKRIMAIVRGGDVYESRVSSWASIRTSGPVQRPEEWPERPEPLMAQTASPDEVVLGRVVIMDEDAVRNGALDSIREFEMHALPMTFGSGPGADMRVGDAGGLIAAEEARVWVQRGRLVFHKLTTLSAMATEGVTAGWQFLEDGDEMRIGPYRLIFQAQQQEEVQEEVVPAPDRLPQEHGMALRPTGTDSPTAGQVVQSWNPDIAARRQAGQPPSLHDFNTPGQDGAARTWGRDFESSSPLWGADSPAQSPLWGAEDAEADGGGGEEDASAWGDTKDEESVTTWGSVEESQVSSWGVVEDEPNNAAPVEWASETKEDDHSAWSFSEQTAASEWTSDSPAPAAYDWNDNAGSVQAGPWTEIEPPAGPAAGAADAASEGEPEQAPTVGPEDAELNSWQSGEWSLDADEEDQA